MRNLIRLSTIAFFVLLFATQATAQGLLFNGVSSVNLSMGGAATGAPLDSVGAIYWNSASISAMDPEMSWGLFDIMPKSTVSSSVFGGLAAGSTDSSAGGTVVPQMGLIYRKPCSRWTFGLATTTVAGSRVNYPADPSNPIFTPQSNTPGSPGGLGPLFGFANYFQLTGVASYALNDRWSIGCGAILNGSSVQPSPNVLSGRDDADGSGQPRFSRDSGHVVHWGGGFQLGVFYLGPNHWNFGAAIKSEQWFEPARWDVTDELGLPRRGSWHGELPMIVSAGASYTGHEFLVYAIDIKYLDYANTSGCGDKGFGQNDEVLGLANDSIFALSLGVQAQLTERFYARFGWTANEAAQGDDDANEAAFGPFFYQHTVHTGLSYEINQKLRLDGSYSYTLPAQVSGPIVTPDGVVPGSNVTVDFEAHLLALAATVKY